MINYKPLYWFMIVGILIMMGGIGMVACSSESDSDGQGGEMSVPTQTTVEVDGYPLTCVSIVGYSNYGGGISCDWDTWRELKG